jgi:DNA-binding GntR family transcriptional regulator
MPVLSRPRVEKEGETARVYRLLKDAILQCGFSPGDFLIEVDLARQCNTSRTPVREACNRLCQEGWITQIRYKGYRVPEISMREITELYEYRKVLECFTAGKASETASDERLNALAATIDIENGPDPNLAELVQGNERFHLALAALAGNQRICNQLKMIFEHVRRLDMLGSRRDTEWIPHREILDAIRMRNRAEAQCAMAKHVDKARNQMLKLFGGSR